MDQPNAGGGYDMILEVIFRRKTIDQT
jgi:hypothetical protein